VYNITLPEGAPKVLAVKLTVIGERSVRSSHPWIFTDSIEKINKEGTAGDIAIIFSHSKNKAIGVGLYDPDSPIRIKMLHFGSGAALNSAFFSEKIKNAYALRVPLLRTKTNSYRLLFGENDGFPGCIADMYAKVLVVKLYSAIWIPYLTMLLDSLIAVSGAETVVVRLSRKLQQDSKTTLTDGMVLYGSLANETILFKEHGIHFSANVIKGHKTGYFLDHRENRRRVGRLSHQKTVLDVFSYAGGFSIHALANGAKEVTSMDISAQALVLAKANGLLNKHKGSHKTIVGDAFVEMQTLIDAGKAFDIVVIDPPSFAKSKNEIQIAKKKYKQLAQLGEKLTAKKGMLVLASCSSRITADVFFDINTAVLDAQKRSYTQGHQSYHDIDHPIGFPEGAYLKCGYYQF
jgi:23S rRNA (cytosine1962-C5)-methyltransferase